MAPKSSSQFEEARIKSREKIMNAALSLFAREGYHSASISKIALKAGVSKGLLYNYFKSKSELLDALITRSFADSDEAFGGLMRIEDPYQQLVLLIEGTFEMAKKDKRHWQLITAVMTQMEVIEQIKTGLDSYFKGYLGLLEAIFTRLGAKNPKAESYKFWALIDGIMMHYVIVFADHYPIDIVKAQILSDYAGFADSPDKTLNI